MRRALVCRAGSARQEALATVPVDRSCMTNNDNAYLLASAPTPSPRQQREMRSIRHRQISVPTLWQRIPRIKPNELSLSHQKGRIHSQYEDPCTRVDPVR